jgi:hypothetical protein
MGFNHGKIGCKSVRTMFDSFSSGDRNQIVGLFDFINADSKMVRFLRRGDFVGFARLYNGPAKAAVYSERMEKHCEEFKRLMQKNVDKGTC